MPAVICCQRHAGQIKIAVRAISSTGWLTLVCRGIGSSLPGIVTVLWALYNCIGPYLLLHYSCFGRGDSLRQASAAAMAATVVLAAAAVALVYAFAPAAYDYGLVS